MFRSQRLEGLELLRTIGAPVPNWQTVKSPGDIDRLILPQVEFGWTIRTCRTDGQREMGLFYLNYAAPDKVAAVLAEKLLTAGYFFYIVYPSWQFRFSCNIVSREANLYIEGIYGTQKDLAVGKTKPDFGLLVPYGVRSAMSCYAGAPSEEVSSWLGRILWWCKRIPLESFYTELALTTTPALIFYELFAA